MNNYKKEHINEICFEFWKISKELDDLKARIDSRIKELKRTIDSSEIPAPTARPASLIEYIVERIDKDKKFN